LYAQEFYYIYVKYIFEQLILDFVKVLESKVTKASINFNKTNKIVNCSNILNFNDLFHNDIRASVDSHTMLAYAKISKDLYVALIKK